MAAPFSGPGHWNDPDMLEVGNGGMNDLENRSHMNLWAMLAAPLFAGNDVRTMTETTRGILLNRKLIAIDQDGLGRQAVLKRKLGAFEIWERPLENGDRAVLLLNVAEMPESHEFSWRSIDVPLPTSILDPWSTKGIPATTQIRIDLRSHESRLLRLSFQ
jgi:alpha-galactosidase